MDYTEFVIDYTKGHPGMSQEDLRDAIPIAWRRHNNPPTGDMINRSHWDRLMEIEIERALSKLDKLKR